MHYLAVDIGESTLDTVVIVSQLGVVDSEEMQHSGVEIVPRNRPLNGFPTDLIRVPERETWFEACTGHPATETVAIVVTTRANFVLRGLCKRRSPKLGREQHQRVVEHPALLQITKQRGNRFVDSTRLDRVILFHILVCIPARTWASRPAGLVASDP